MRRLRVGFVWSGLTALLLSSACGGKIAPVDQEPNDPQGGAAGDSSVGGASTGGASCGGSTFDDDDDDATACVKWSDCSAGEALKKAGSATSDRQCAACEQETFSAEKNQKTCGAWAECSPGQYVSKKGSATADRKCADCAGGSFSTKSNASSCTPWTECSNGYLEDEPGTAASDRTCQDAVWWTDRWSYSNAYGVSADERGNVYVAGTTGFLIEYSTNALVKKYDRAGTLLWERLIVSEEDDPEWRSSAWARSVSVDGSGNVYVVGTTNGWFTGQTPMLGSKAYVRKYDSEGTELWTRQFESSSNASSVSVDGSGNLYVAGTAKGVLTGQTAAGKDDAYVRKYDSDGTELWTRQFGSSENDVAWAVSVDGSGNVYVAGYTKGVLPGQPTTAGKSDAYVRKYDSEGTELWTSQFGSNANDEALSVSADGSGNVFVAGSTDGMLPGQQKSGTRDAFVRKYAANGSEEWTRQFGGSDQTYAEAVRVDGSGNVYVAVAPDAESSVRKYDGEGRELLTWRFGLMWASVEDLTVDGSGRVYAVGAVADEDGFVMSLKL